MINRPEAEVSNPKMVLVIIGIILLVGGVVCGIINVCTDNVAYSTLDGCCALGITLGGMLLGIIGMLE